MNMMRGGNRQMRRMMDKMGLDMEEIPNVQEVIIKTDKKEIIIPKPSVTEMKSKENSIFQVIAESFEIIISFLSVLMMTSCTFGISSISRPILSIILRIWRLPPRIMFIYPFGWFFKLSLTFTATPILCSFIISEDRIAFPTAITLFLYRTGTSLWILIFLPHQTT